MNSSWRECQCRLDDCPPGTIRVMFDTEVFQSGVVAKPPVPAQLVFSPVWLRIARCVGLRDAKRVESHQLFGHCFLFPDEFTTEYHNPRPADTAAVLDLAHHAARKRAESEKLPVSCLHS